MLKGLTMFAQGLYIQALDRSRRENISLERAFETEIEEMNVFLVALDTKYYEELRPKHDVAESMRLLTEWTATHGKESSDVVR